MENLGLLYLVVFVVATCVSLIYVKYFMKTDNTINGLSPQQCKEYLECSISVDNNRNVRVLEL